MENAQRHAMGFVRWSHLWSPGDFIGDVDVAAFTYFSRNPAGHEGRSRPPLSAGNQSAHRACLAVYAAGRRPDFLQYRALAIAGALAGIGGAHLSLAVTLTWDEGMTAGRGFIAIALVIFAKWNPLWAVIGALVFGGAEALQLQFQAFGVDVSPFVMNMIPYLLTLLILIFWGWSRNAAAPAALGRNFFGVE